MFSDILWVRQPLIWRDTFGSCPLIYDLFNAFIHYILVRVSLCMTIAYFNCVRICSSEFCLVCSVIRIVCIDDVTHDLVLHALFCLFLFLFLFNILVKHFKYYIIICLLHLLRIVYHDNAVQLLLIIAVYDTRLIFILCKEILLCKRKRKLCCHYF